jgi:hypothetical protein
MSAPSSGHGAEGAEHPEFEPRESRDWRQSRLCFGITERSSHGGANLREVVIAVPHRMILEHELRGERRIRIQ